MNRGTGAPLSHQGEKQQTYKVEPLALGAAALIDVRTPKLLNESYKIAHSRVVTALHSPPEKFDNEEVAALDRKASEYEALYKRWNTTSLTLGWASWGLLLLAFGAITTGVAATLGKLSVAAWPPRYPLTEERFRRKGDDLAILSSNPGKRPIGSRSKRLCRSRRIDSCSEPSGSVTGLALAVAMVGDICPG